MKRWIVLGAALLLLFLTGCSSSTKTLTFAGDSPNWSGKYIVIITGKTHTSEYILKYKGTDVKSVGEVNFSISGPTEGGSDRGTLSENGEIHGQMPLLGGVPPEDKPIKVTVKWSGETELFNMTIPK